MYLITLIRPSSHSNSTIFQSYPGVVIIRCNNKHVCRMYNQKDRRLGGETQRPKMEILSCRVRLEKVGGLHLSTFLPPDFSFSIAIPCPSRSILSSFCWSYWCISSLFSLCLSLALLPLFFLFSLLSTLPGSSL